MKNFTGCVCILFILMSCETKVHTNELKQAGNPIIGTWLLISGTTIQKTDTTVTDYTKNKKFIKTALAFAAVSHQTSKLL